MRAISGERVTRRVPLTISVPNPAAGADWTVTVPGGKQWHVESIVAVLTTSAVAASRRPRLLITNGNITILDIASQVAETASLGWVNCWAPGLYSANDGLHVNVGIPEVYVDAGWVIKTSTALIDAGDQWSSVTLQVIEETTARAGSQVSDAEDVNIIGVDPHLLGA